MTKALEAAIKRAQRLAPSFSSQIERSLQAGDFGALRTYVDSERSLSMTKAIWSAVPRAIKPGLLAESLSSGDAPCLELVFTVRAMREVRRAGDLVISSPKDQAFFDALPLMVTAYRGTTQAELDDAPFFGVCWTTDQGRASWFATQHFRFRRTDSQPLVLTQSLDKSDIAGGCNGRKELEVFVDSITTWRTMQNGALNVQRAFIDENGEGPGVRLRKERG